jgi:Sec-independent protein translocase protein TatA
VEGYGPHVCIPLQILPKEIVQRNAPRHVCQSCCVDWWMQAAGQKAQAIEQRALSIIRELDLQALRQEIDHQESELLARDLGRFLQRIRRSSNMTIETMGQLTQELNREKKNVSLQNRKKRSLESEIGSLTRESINVNAAILQLEQMLEMG